MIPGHGGAMDRFDCQFIMGLAAYVYCTTFINSESGSFSPLIVSAVVSRANMMSDADLLALVSQLRGMLSLRGLVEV